LEKENTNKSFYLKRAKLLGYKSIKNVDVEFCDGLNIIIGKNASGKTNLLSFLDRLMLYKTTNNFEFESKLIFSGNKNLMVETSSKKKNIADFNSNNLAHNLKRVVKINKKEVKFHRATLNLTFIKHWIPENYPIVNRSLNLSVDKDGWILDEIFPLLTEFLNKLTFKFLNNNLDTENLTIDKIAENIKASFGDINKINNLISFLTPIEEIKLGENYNVYLDNNAEKFLIDNLKFEHKVSNSWLPYSSLSDGTKRLFYIISELFFGNYNQNNSSEFRKHLVFLEEPELGIHPHQLHLLMNFIKDQSKDKQIILTTHSPQVLNILGKDELHRIIIASNEDPKIGSQFRHLTKKEIEKAQKYLEDEYIYLSDYWMHFDLEK